MKVSEIRKAIMETEWKPIDVIGVMDALLKKLNLLEQDEGCRLSYQTALVYAMESLLPLVDGDFKKENEGFMRVLITDRERLLQMYQSPLE